MAHIENAPSPKAESVACHLGGDSGVPSIVFQALQTYGPRPGPILAQHWFRDVPILEARA